MALKRVLAGSPVCQKPEILEAFLHSFGNLNHDEFQLDYLFADDNNDERSSRLLEEFEREGSKVTVFRPSGESGYVCNEESHHWNDSLMLRVGELKNRIIRYALDGQYDALFLVDSDLILHPGLLEQLGKTNKEVISEIFWTCWHPGQPREPNVWLFDEYDLVYRTPGEELDKASAERRKMQFLNQLKAPGVYEVGGLGACTLISRNALLRGVDFSYISNLTIHGEDRFFCIRAAVLGVGLFVDTTDPAYHIYRASDLEGVADYAAGGSTDSVGSEAEGSTESVGSEAGVSCGGLRETRDGNRRPRIVLTMAVRNETGRYLERVLAGIGDRIDEAVIIDDASEDDTVKLCEELLQDIPHRILQNKRQMFANEVELRRKQWDETLKTGPDWILNLDADEVPEIGFWDHLREMAENEDCDQYGFRLYDMWNETQYREDPYWNAHENRRVFLLRYHPEFAYVWKETPQHCGRFPENLKEFPLCDSPFRIQHFGWARPEDRKAKYDRYRRLDPEAVYGIRRQYESILDSYPHLLPWTEGDGHEKQEE